MATKRSPFDVKLSADEKRDFVDWLAWELRAAIDAKTTTDVEVDYWHTLYEQARTRLSRNTPWPDAADLTSYIASEKVDAVHARILRTVWVEPIWSVEGWGPAADNAPFVEEFHQWKAEEERLQSALDKLVLISLIEPRGLLEITEASGLRPVRKTMTAKVKVDETGLPIFDSNGQPLLDRADNGSFIPADENDPQVSLVIDAHEPIRTGPSYHIIPYRDSVIMPGHARDKEEIWGYGKRFWRRLAELRERAEAGVYDADAVEQLTATSDRPGSDVSSMSPALARSGMAIAPESTPQTIEKELWECTVLTSIAGKPERWYVATFHLAQRVLLRLQYDDLDTARHVPIILYPRTDRATEGFSLIGHKLITVIEEHTAWRNMIADRASLAGQAPVKRLTGALWDPLDQPWGPKAVIDVRDHREIEPVQVPDVPASLIGREQAIERTAERITGVNDISSGQFATESRTLGEIQMATEQSFVRMDVVTRRFQEAMEDIAQIRHAIWKRVLAERGDEGMAMPLSMQTGLESKGVSIPGGTITAQMLEGEFRFKPRGSVETADPRALRADFNGALQALPNLLQMMPMIQQAFGPHAPRAIMDQFVRVYRIPNRQAFLGSPSQAALPPVAGPTPTPTQPGPPSGQGPGTIPTAPAPNSLPGFGAAVGSMV